MNVLSITQLNNLIKRTIDREYLLKNVYVSGTITNAKRHSSGHVYFSLKDEESSIDVTMWSSTVQSKGLANAFQNGLLVTIKASVNFYNKMGRLNLIASDMQVGSKSPLQLEFDALQRELSALGYFDDAHKQPIPVLSSCIGIKSPPLCLPTKANERSVSLSNHLKSNRLNSFRHHAVVKRFRCYTRE